MCMHASVENSVFRLRRAGWSASDAVFCEAGGQLLWFVTVHKGEEWISVEGESQEEAWDKAAQEAEGRDWYEQPILPR